eukprot:s987_g6.t1
MLVPAQPESFAPRPRAQANPTAPRGKQPSLSIQDRHVAPKGAPKSYAPPRPESRRLKDAAGVPCQSARQNSERSSTSAAAACQSRASRDPGSRSLAQPTQPAPRERSNSMIADPEGKLRQIFEAVDVNRDGSINKREMIKFCRSSPDLAALLGFPEGVRQEDGSRDILERRFQAIDRDDDREVTWEEFLDFFLAEMAVPPVASAACPACEVEPSEPEPEGADYREDRRLEGPAPASNCGASCSSMPRQPSGGPAGRRVRKYPRVPVDEAFERAFEQKHQEWLKQDEKMRLAEEETRQAGVRAVQRLLEELSDNPFELIPRASELSAEVRDPPPFFWAVTSRSWMISH